MYNVIMAAGNPVPLPHPPPSSTTLCGACSDVHYESRIYVSHAAGTRLGPAPVSQIEPLPLSPLPHCRRHPLPLVAPPPFLAPLAWRDILVC